jgi:hypothetical protein
VLNNHADWADAPDELINVLQINKLKPKDPGAEVIALSPRTLVATNRFVCEICNKGFQRDQNLQLHRRGHNLPWKLRQRSSLVAPSSAAAGSGGRQQQQGEAAPPRKRVYVCPEPTCVHHDPARYVCTVLLLHICEGMLAT